MTEKHLSDAEVEWMRHSHQLTMARLHGLRPDADWQLRKRLEYEKRVEAFVLKNLWRGTRLQGSARVWLRYMARHAELQVQRYAGRLIEAEFHQRCTALRNQRDLEDRRCAGVPWLPEEEIKT